MAFKLSLPKILSGTEDSGDQTVTVETVSRDGDAPETKTPVAFGAGLLAQYPITRQLQILGTALLVLMLVVGVLVPLPRQSGFGIQHGLRGDGR